MEQNNNPTNNPGKLLITARIWAANSLNLFLAASVVIAAELSGIPQIYAAGFITLAALGNLLGAWLCRSRANSMIRIAKAEAGE